MQHSIVNLNEIRKSPFGNRIDAEFYLPDYIRLDAAINKIGFEPLSQITSKIDVGFVGPMAQEYTEDGVWLLQTQNVQEFFLSEASQTRINTEFHHYLDISKVRKGDILIARSGSFGKASIYLEDEEINSADIIIIRSIETRVNPFYLVAFLNCTFGTNQLLRYASGGVQGHVNLTILENLKVCSLNTDFQERIESICKRSYLTKQQSELLYSQAQTVLLSELGLVDWQPRHSLAFVKNYADIQQAARIDAEHFQPRYDDLLRQIRAYPAGWVTLEDLIRVKDRNYEPKDNTRYKYIELSDIGNSGEITGCTAREGQNLPSRARRKVEMGDVIVSSIEGSLSRIAMVDQEFDQALCSTGFYVVRSKELNSETLLVLMKSIVGQLQLKRGCSGTILTAINKGELKRLILPVIPLDIQAQIKQNIIDSYNLRKQSKHLLECAKRTVEIAIEQDEQVAIEWLTSETQLQEDSHAYNGEKLPALLVPADALYVTRFPKTRWDLVKPVVDALFALGGQAPRREIISQVIGKLGLPPYTDDTYWQGLEPALHVPKRKRKILFENRLDSALQILKDQGRIKSQGGRWHLQS